MLHSSLAIASALFLCATAAAQQTVRPVEITSPIKDAGIYHYATGTWTRAGAQASLGPDVVFNATFPCGYYTTSFSGMQLVDQGVIPGPERPAPNEGTTDEYFVDGWQFAYCCYDTALAVEFKWYDAYSPCDDVSTPTSCINQTGTTFQVAGLPVNGCWIVTIDIAGSGLEVCFQSEGGGGTCYPGYDADLNLDSFGWGAQYVQPGTAFTGPLLAGYDDTWVTPGEETCYNPTPSACTPEGVGLGAQDFFAIDELNGCYWFGGYVAGAAQCSVVNPPGQFHLVLYGHGYGYCPYPPCDNPYCGTNNTGTTRMYFCTVSWDLTLSHTGMTGCIAGYALVGAGSDVIADPPGATGDLCLGGAAMGRYVMDLFYGEYAETDLTDGAHGGGTGQIPTLGGTYAAGQTWNFQAWYRVPGGSRFTDATTITLRCPRSVIRPDGCCGQRRRPAWGA